MDALGEKVMKVQVEKGSLVQILQRIQSVTEKKSSMPILSNTLVKASAEQMLDFSATDLELSIWTQSLARVDDAGNITVSAKKLLEIVRELPHEYIVLESQPNSKLNILAGRSRFELATIPAEDFPHLSFYQDDLEPIPCDPVLLRKSLSKTLYGIPVEEDPFSTAGLFWHPVDSGQYRFVSSDGHRLAYFQVPGESFENIDISNGIIIPRKGVQEILRILEKETETALGIHENCLILKTPNTYLSIRLLEGQFPDYQLIIPEERPFSFMVDWETFYYALKRVAVLTDQRWRHVRFLISNGTLQLESGNPEVGNASDVLDIDYEGDDFTVAFNIRYVLDAVQAIESPQIRFEWVDQYHGGVFLGSDDPGYLSLVMPMVI